MANLSLNNYRLPDQEDFEGAMTAVMRLQDTYDLEPKEIASGNLGKEKSLSMDGRFELYAGIHVVLKSKGLGIME